MIDRQHLGDAPVRRDTYLDKVGASGLGQAADETAFDLPCLAPSVKRKIKNTSLKKLLTEA